MLRYYALRMSSSGLKSTSLFLLTGILAAQTQTYGPPWRHTGTQPVANQTAGLMTGPMVVTATGDLYAANTLAGVTRATRIVGDVSKSYTVISKVSASSGAGFAVDIGGSYLIYALTVDRTGNVLIAGKALPAGLPVAASAFRPESAGDQSGFLCKLNASDGSLVFCTYLGSNQVDIVAVGTDLVGNVYVVVNQTVDPGLGIPPSLPVTPGAVSLGDRQIAVIKVDPTGSKLLYTAELGGAASVMTVDTTGNVYIAGESANIHLGSGTSTFLAKLNASGTQVVYASYDPAPELLTSMAVDGSGRVYLLGTKVVTGNVFVRKYSSDGSSVIYERSLTQKQFDSTPASIAVDDLGIATIAGSTTELNFPVHNATDTCHFTASSGAPDGFLVRLSPSGDLLQATFLPADGSTIPVAIAAQSATAYVAANDSSSPDKFSVLQLGPDLNGTAETTIGCVGSAATIQGGTLAPGEIISIFGESLGPAAPVSWKFDAHGRVASELAGVAVTFDGVPAPLLYVRAAQINAVTPWELIGKSVAQMCITFQVTHCANVGLQSAAPAMFQLGHYAAATNADGTLNSPRNPATPGSAITLYLTGLGPLSPLPSDGAIVQAPLPTLASSVQVWYPNPDFHVPIPIQAQIVYAGAAPLQVAGLDLIKVIIPDSATSGAIWVALQTPDGSSFQSPPGFLAIKQ